MAIQVGNMDTQGPCNFYVYAHSRVSDGSIFYIGKGRGERLARSSSRNKHWHNIVNKEGGFSKHHIAKNLPEDFALFVESECIDLYRRRGARLVNVTPGGDGKTGARHSDEYKLKMSEKMRGNTYGVGRKHTDEARERISATMRGRPSNTKGMKFSDAQLVNVRRAHEKLRGIPRPPEIAANMRGRKYSAETLKRMSEAQIGRKHSDETKAKMRAQVWTPEQREAARIRATGRVASEATRMKMSASQKARGR